LNPALTPEAAPALKSSYCCSIVNLKFPDMNLLICKPSSTDGPSGPKELPVPRVATAAVNLAKYFSISSFFPFETSPMIPGIPGAN